MTSLKSAIQEPGRNMMKHLCITIAALAFTTPLYANDALTPTGDAVAGAKAFGRHCVSCHVAKDPDGNILAGRRGRTGPNLYGVAGRVAGSADGFRYSRALTSANDAGLIWDNNSFTAFVQDPTGYLRNELNDNRARAKMSFRVRKEQDALDIYAFLHSLSDDQN